MNSQQEQPPIAAGLVGIALRFHERLKRDGRLRGELRRVRSADDAWAIEAVHQLKEQLAGFRLPCEFDAGQLAILLSHRSVSADAPTSNRSLATRLGAPKGEKSRALSAARFAQLIKADDPEIRFRVLRRALGLPGVGPLPPGILADGYQLLLTPDGRRRFAHSYFTSQERPASDAQPTDDKD